MVMRNPLQKRIVRELRTEWKKYLVVSVFMILTIGFVSAIYVTNSSMLATAKNSQSIYHLEDGHFELKKKASAVLQKKIASGEKADIKAYYQKQAYKKIDATIPEADRQAAYKQAEQEIDSEYQKAIDEYDLNDSSFIAQKVKIYPNFFKETTEKINHKSSTIRIYTIRKSINRACVMEGSLPKKNNEIAIDRMHADNAGIKVGDTLKIGHQTFIVSGLVANVDYSALFQKNSDVMFDALTFDVGLVTNRAFASIDTTIHYNYAYKFTNQKGSNSKAADDFLAALITQTETNNNKIEDFLPAYINQAIQFTQEDMGSDRAMCGMILYILIVVMAFIFAITISSTITKEASVIGTLRSLGYTKKELWNHFMIMPMLVMLFACCIGNLLGYTILKNVVVQLYYNSYSLPTYHTLFSWDAFIQTTAVPLCLMLVIDGCMIHQKLQLSPLAFLRNDLSKAKQPHTIPLRHGSFMHRIRARVILQNIPAYLILFIGIFFVMLMLSIAIGLPDTLSYYQNNVSSLMLAKNETILNDENVQTHVASAESFFQKTLEYKTDSFREDVSVFGVQPNSSYVKSKQIKQLKRHQILISQSIHDKYDVQVGDTITLHGKYDSSTYKLKVAGIYNYSGSLAIFMSNTQFRSMFDEYAKGWFSNKKINEIDRDSIATTITKKDVIKVAKQLDHSMGSFMKYFQYLCTGCAVILLYLLTKLIIERNEKAISMTKILGYTTKEIVKIYIVPTTIVVFLSVLVSTFMSEWLMIWIWKAMMQRMDGWFAFVLSTYGKIYMILLVFVGYLFVMILDIQRFRKIPMDSVLKNNS